MLAFQGEVACSTSLHLISRYQRGLLFQGENPNNVRAGLWIGYILLFLSICGCLLLGITKLAKIRGFEYEEYGLYAALVPCLLAAFWSSVLIFDARYYWRMWQRVLSNMAAGPHVIFRS